MHYEYQIQELELAGESPELMLLEIRRTNLIRQSERLMREIDELSRRIESRTATVPDTQQIQAS